MLLFFKNVLAISFEKKHSLKENTVDLLNLARYRDRTVTVP
jgi:hypothetical protein